MEQRKFNLYLARTAGMLSGARRVAMLLVTLLLTMTAQTAWAQQPPIDIGGIVYELYGDSPDNCTATVVSVAPNENIMIPSTVEYNDEYYTVTSIGNDAFSGFQNLISITIPASVTSIGPGAFCDCSQLSTVDFEPGSQLESIGDNAFSGCQNLTFIFIPASVTTIGEDAFFGCSTLTSVTIPECVTSIGDNAFDNCESLEIINVDGNNQNYASEDGVLFNKDKTILIKYPASKPGVDYDDVTYYFIPSSVETIAEGAFDEGIELIIFYNENINGIPDDDDKYKFIAAIQYNPDEVTVEGMLIQIDGNDYYPEGTTITLTPPDDDHAISSIIITNISNGEDVTESLLQGLTFTMPAYDVNVDVELADVTGNFGNNGDLTWTMSDVNEDGTYETLTISGTGEMDDSTPWEDAFKSTITTVVISDGVTNIHDGTFYQYPNLTTVTIGSGVTSIGDNAFDECTSLESVTFGENSQLTTIGGSAFNGCTSLVSITIPDGVTSVGSDAFGNTPWFENEENQENGIVYVGKVAYEWKGSATSAVIKDGTVAIAPSAFTAASITSVTIPDGVTTIGEQAFNASHLTSITIPASVTSIGDYAFLSCSGLASVYVLPTIPPTLGHDPFYYCNVLSAIVVPTAAYDTYYNATGWNSYQSILKPATCTVTFDKQGGSGGSDEVTATYGEAMPAITIPTKTGYDFGGYFTEEDGVGTQYYNASGTSIHTWNIDAATTLYAKWTARQNTVTLDQQGGEGGTTSVNATYDSAMPDIAVPTRTGYDFGGYFTEEDGGGTKYYNADGTSDTNCDLTAATTLYALWTPMRFDVDDITYEWTSESTVKIYKYNGTAAELTIPASVEHNGVPYTVTEIGHEAFMNNSTLTSIDISSNSNPITIIGARAFKGCTNLFVIHFPDCVTIIEDEAFSGCALTEFTIPACVTSIGEDVFKDCNANLIIYVPEGLEDFYRTNWPAYIILPEGGIPNGVTLTNDGSGNLTATFDDTSQDEVIIPANITVTAVYFNRSFTSGTASTVMLPFSYPCNGSEGGKFYEFVGVEKSGSQWIATMKEPGTGTNEATTLTANTPYLFMPSGTEMSFPNISGDGVTLNTTGGGNQQSAEGLWKFQGTYTRLEYKEDGTKDLSGNVYGFASTAEDGVQAGEFVKADDGAAVPPMRCYLTYDNGAAFTGARGVTRGESEEVPETITVRLIGKNGDINGIGTLTLSTGEFSTEGWYSLDGRRLDGKPTKKGLYIHDGEKVVIK